MKYILLVPDGAADEPLSDLDGKTPLEVARTPDHAKAQQAKDLLQPYLVQDYGSDWVKAQEKLAVWLKEHPDT